VNPETLKLLGKLKNRGSVNPPEGRVSYNTPHNSIRKSKGTKPQYAPQGKKEAVNVRNLNNQFKESAVD
jgi:hypothetical protein